MKVTLQENADNFEIVKAMASKDRETAIAAQEALAGLVGPMLNEVINQAPVLANFYTRQSYDMGTVPMIPMDTFYDISDYKYMTVWSQTSQGGLGTNEVVPTVGETTVKTYNLNSAHSFDKKYAANPRMGLNVVSKTMAKLLQEILYIQENYSMGPIAAALAGATTGARKHVQRVTSAGRLIPADFNELLTLATRISVSQYGGTPVGGARNITDLIMSPEMMEQLRAMSYNPINTAEAPYTSAAKDSIAAPDSVRSAMFEGGDLASFYGKTLHVFHEFGKGKKFNSIFDRAAGSTTFARPDGSTGSATFDGANEEIILGLDRGREGLLRLSAVDGDGSEFRVESDDQFYSKRASKIGFYGSLEEGRLIPDARVLTGLIS